ncbi:unnamed protein product, partial [Protopolystoma xenopodis]
MQLYSTELALLLKERQRRRQHQGGQRLESQVQNTDQATSQPLDFPATAALFQVHTNSTASDTAAEASHFETGVLRQSLHIKPQPFSLRQPYHDHNLTKQQQQQDLQHNLHDPNTSHQHSHAVTDPIGLQKRQQRQLLNFNIHRSCGQTRINRQFTGLKVASAVQLPTRFGLQTRPVWHSDEGSRSVGSTNSAGAGDGALADVNFVACEQGENMLLSSEGWPDDRRRGIGKTTFSTIGRDEINVIKTKISSINNKNHGDRNDSNFRYQGSRSLASSTNKKSKGIVNNRGRFNSLIGTCGVMGIGRTKEGIGEGIDVESRANPSMVGEVTRGIDTSVQTDKAPALQPMSP